MKGFLRGAENFGNFLYNLFKPIYFFIGYLYNTNINIKVIGGATNDTSR